MGVRFVLLSKKLFIPLFMDALNPVQSLLRDCFSASFDARSNANSFASAMSSSESLM